MILKNKTRILTSIGNQINKYQNNFIFWNDFQIREIDFITALATFGTVTSDTDLSILLFPSIDAAYLSRFSEQHEGLEVRCDSQDKYILRLELGKIILNSPLTTSVTNTPLQYRYVTNIKNKVDNTFSVTFGNYNIFLGNKVINNKVYGKKGYTLRCSGGGLPSFLYTIPTNFTTITDFSIITDLSANWFYTASGLNDSGNAGFPINKNTGTNLSINSTSIITQSFDGYNPRNYITGGLNYLSDHPKQKFIPKITISSSSGQRAYYDNLKFIINASNYGTIIDRNTHPYIQFAFYQFNGNADGRYQEISKIFILGNANMTDTNVMRFINYLKIRYNDSN